MSTTPVSGDAAKVETTIPADPSDVSSVAYTQGEAADAYLQDGPYQAGDTPTHPTIPPLTAGLQGGAPPDTGPATIADTHTTAPTQSVVPV